MLDVLIQSLYKICNFLGFLLSLISIFQHLFITYSYVYSCAKWDCGCNIRNLKDYQYKDITHVASRSSKSPKLAMQLAMKKAIGALRSKELEKLIAVVNLANGDEFFVDVNRNVLFILLRIFTLIILFSFYFTLTKLKYWCVGSIIILMCLLARGDIGEVANNHTWEMWKKWSLSSRFWKHLLGLGHALHFFL